MPLLSLSWFGVGVAVMVATYAIAKSWAALGKRRKRRARPLPKWWVETIPGFQTWIPTKSMVIQVRSRREVYCIDTVELSDPDFEDKVIAAQEAGAEKAASLTSLTS